MALDQQALGISLKAEDLNFWQVALRGVWFTPRSS